MVFSNNRQCLQQENIKKKQDSKKVGARAPYPSLPCPPPQTLMNHWLIINTCSLLYELLFSILLEPPAPPPSQVWPTWNFKYDQSFCNLNMEINRLSQAIFAIPMLSLPCNLDIHEITAMYMAFFDARRSIKVFKGNI